MSAQTGTRGKTSGKKSSKQPRQEAPVSRRIAERKLVLGLSERQIALFLLEFLLISAGLLWVWYVLGEYYQAVVFFVARQILLLLGYTPAQISAVKLTNAYLVNFNLVPLVALAIATPRVVRRRRIEMLAFGISVLFLLHVFDTVVHLPYFYELLMQRPGFATLIVNSIGVVGVAAPFIIWFVLCRDAIFSK